MTRECQLIKVDLGDSSTWQLEGVSDAIQGGAVILYPTDTLYGLGCSPFVADAVARIHRIKMRNEHKPMLVLMDDMQAMADLAEEIPRSFYALARRFWPGPVTFILKAAPTLPHVLTAGLGTVGVRMPEQPFTRELLRRCRLPLVSTSANLSGTNPLLEIKLLLDLFQRQVDYFIDAGNLASAVSSTVIRLVGDEVTLIREGRIPFSDIQAALKG
ncbi:MAG: threonylcarbamoyl-AMP synthase [Acidobacteria bacterium]|nr:threonylcarbamoyl-AMP synthase [Acidobacteriota bacterium]MBI3657979.1 threonylcarbamoyl-AMP synthase [Acidobacteriota bacterium]